MINDVSLLNLGNYKLTTKVANTSSTTLKLMPITFGCLSPSYFFLFASERII